MFAFRSRPAVTRVQTIRRPLGVCSVLPRSNFSAAALLRQEITEETSTSNPGAEATDPDADLEPRIPLSIQSVWYRPFRRRAEYGLPVCNLQIRSYSVRNLEFMCDFALRAAYYLNLPASGPVPLPRRTERWTVPRGHFAHKKSQENFERVTYKRLIQIQDGHPETVEIWLAYLKKHQFYGTGMKANVWGFEELGVGKRMNVSLDNLRDTATKPKWAHSGVGKTLETAERVAEILNSPEYRVLANKTNVEEAERELLQAAPLETVGSEGASEAEVDEAIQKVEEEAMKAEESKEVAEVHGMDRIFDKTAELEEELSGLETQPIDEAKVETQTDPLGPSPTIEDVLVTASSQVAEVPAPPPLAQTQEKELEVFALEVILLEAKEALDLPQDPSADQAEGDITTFPPPETLAESLAPAVDAPKETVLEERLVQTTGGTSLPPEASATYPAIETPTAAVETPSERAMGTPPRETETQSPVMEEARHTPEVPVGGALVDTTEAPLPVVEEIKDISKAPAQEALLDTMEDPSPVVEAKEAPLPVVGEVKDISKAPAQEALLDTTENPSPVVEAKDTPGAQVEGGLTRTTVTSPPVVEEGKDVSDAPAEELFVTSIGAATPVPKAQPPVAGEAKGISQATSTQDSCTRLSVTAIPVLAEELRPKTGPQGNTAQTAPEVTEARKAEVEVEAEDTKVTEETAAYETTREGAGEPKPEKKD